MDLSQFVLKGIGCSGRGVRVRILDVALRQRIFEQTARELGPEGTMLALRNAEALEGVRTFLAQVTDRGGFKTEKDLLSPNVVWKNVTNEQLCEGRGLDTYFTSKDVDVLIKAYRKLHEVTDAELDDILGEARVVAAD